MFWKALEAEPCRYARRRGGVHRFSGRKTAFLHQTPPARRKAPGLIVFLAHVRRALVIKERSPGLLDNIGELLFFSNRSGRDATASLVVTPLAEIGIRQDGCSALIFDVPLQ